MDSDIIICQKCGRQIGKTSRYCRYCGVALENSSNGMELTHESANDNKPMGRCQLCERTNYVRKAHYFKNIGMLVYRQNQEINGYFCKDCNKKLFKEYFITDLLLGWWGTISFFVTPFYLVFNLWNFIPSLWQENGTEVSYSNEPISGDEYLGLVIEYTKKHKHISISMIQKEFQLSFARSARLLDLMESNGVIAPAGGAKPRRVIPCNQ